MDAGGYECEACEGRGFVMSREEPSTALVPGSPAEQIDCDQCHGTGAHLDETKRMVRLLWLPSDTTRPVIRWVSVTAITDFYEIEGKTFVHVGTEWLRVSDQPWQLLLKMGERQ